MNFKLFFYDSTKDKISLNDEADFNSFKMFEIPDDIKSQSVKIHVENIQSND